MRKVRGVLLLDTKPLTAVILRCIGLEEEAVAHTIEKLGLPLASAWPVFTEALYFIYRDLGKRRDFEELLEKVKVCLHRVAESSPPFHEVADKLEKEFDLADTTLIEILKRNPCYILVSDDRKLVEKARKEGLFAITTLELVYLMQS